MIQVRQCLEDVSLYSKKWHYHKICFSTSVHWLFS